MNLNQNNEPDLPENRNNRDTLGGDNKYDNYDSQYSQTFSHVSGLSNKKSKLIDMFLLRDEQGRKSINRVCCIKINKHWTIRKQMIVSLMVLSFSVFLLVIGIVIGNLVLTRYLIKKSSEEAIQQQIKENLHNSAKEYSNAIMEIFNGYTSTLEILSRIILSALKLDNKLFDFDYVKEFPVIGLQQYFSVLDPVPPDQLATSAAAK